MVNCQSTSTAMTLHSVQEAGSAGRDTRGLIRLHQFTRLKWSNSQNQKALTMNWKKMVVNAENILQKLNLPCSVITFYVLAIWDSQLLKPTTWKFGFQHKTLTTWNFFMFKHRRFQARRAQIRYRDEADGKSKTSSHSQQFRTCCWTLPSSHIMKTTKTKMVQ